MIHTIYMSDNLNVDFIRAWFLLPSHGLDFMFTWLLGLTLLQVLDQEAVLPEPYNSLLVSTKSIIVYFHTESQLCTNDLAELGHSVPFFPFFFCWVGDLV